MDSIKDSLVTVGQGTAGVALSFWEVLPDILRIAILFLTAARITLKIIKDYYKYYIHGQLKTLKYNSEGE